MIHILTEAKFSPGITALLSSFLFGLSHAHHSIAEIYTKNPDYGLIAFKIGTVFLNNAVFQFSFTFLFGLYAAFIFFITQRSFFAPILCHSFCNFMGVPDIGEVIESKKYCNFFV